MIWVKHMLSDSTEIISSKRVITFLTFLLCAAAFIGNTWFGYKVDINLFNSLIYIVIAGL